MSSACFEQESMNLNALKTILIEPSLSHVKDVISSANHVNCRKARKSTISIVQDKNKRVTDAIGVLGKPGAGKHTGPKTNENIPRF